MYRHGLNYGELITDRSAALERTSSLEIVCGESSKKVRFRVRGDIFYFLYVKVKLNNAPILFKRCPVGLYEKQKDVTSVRLLFLRLLDQLLA